MKKLLIVSMIVAGTFASAGIASADDAINASGYTGWAHDAFSSASGS